MKAEMFNCEFWVNGSNNIEIMLECKRILEKSGFTILNMSEHYFTPVGYTALFLLAESHLAIHTFPEENKTYIQVTSCSEEKYEKFISFVNDIGLEVMLGKLSIINWRE